MKRNDSRLIELGLSKIQLRRVCVQTYIANRESDHFASAKPCAGKQADEYSVNCDNEPGFHI